VYTDRDTVPSTRSRSEEAYTDLKRRLLLGELRLGVRLGEERLAASLGLSRTPVREALLRLHIEGLIDRHPDGGYQPRAPMVNGIRELYEVRLGLELLAIRRPLVTGEAHDARILEQVHEEWAELEDDPPETDPGFVMADEAFHMGIAEAAGNTALVDMLGHINERIRVVRMQDFLSDERVEATVSQHLAIVRALIRSDLEAAAGQMSAHLAESIAVVETLAARALSRMLDSEETRR